MSAHINPVFPEVDTQWMAGGACKGKGDLFFAIGTVSNEARAVCESCPVFGPCDAYAEAYDPAGLWAGLTDRERRRARARRGA